MSSQFLPTFLVLWVTISQLMNMLHIRRISPTVGNYHVSLSRRWGLKLCVLLVIFFFTVVLGMGLILPLNLSRAELQIASGLLLFLLAIGVRRHVNSSNHIPGNEMIVYDQNLIYRQNSSPVVQLCLIALTATFLFFWAQLHGAVWDYLLAFGCVGITASVLPYLSYKLSRHAVFWIALNSLQQFLALILVAVAIQETLRGVHLYASTCR